MYSNSYFTNAAFNIDDENQQQGPGYSAVYYAKPQNPGSPIGLIKTFPSDQPVSQPLILPTTHQPYTHPVIQPLSHHFIQQPVTQPSTESFIEQLISPTKKIYKSRIIFVLAVLSFFLLILLMIGLLLWYFLYDQCLTGRKCGAKGGCVSFTQWCDGHKDCPWGEDESQCFRFYGPNFMLQSFSSTDQKWKTVCADNWHDKVGNITCQQIGYNSSDYVSSRTTNANVGGQLSFVTLNPSYSSDPAQFVQGFLTHTSYCVNGLAVSLRCIACGKPEDPGTEIPNGEVVSTEDRWPWQVSLHYLSVHRCAGSIITPSWIVTSAQCVHKLPGAVNWTVHSGGLNIITMRNLTGTKVSKILKHPSYNKATHENDIALMKLNTALKMSSTVRPVCLPNSGMNISDRREVYVTGWGPAANFSKAPLSTLLREAKISLLNKTLCNSSSLLDGQIYDSMVCAGQRNEDFPCRGDTGSPLVTEMNSFWWLVGAFSWGDSCSDGYSSSYQPGVYTNVTTYIDWIYKQIQEN